MTHGDLPNYWIWNHNKVSVDRGWRVILKQPGEMVHEMKDEWPFGARVYRKVKGEWHWLG